MKNIYDFSRFSSLYEADTASQELKVAETEASKLYDQTLSLILTTALNSYASELSFPIKSYDANIDADIVSIKSSPVADKPAAMIKVMQKVQKAAEDNKLEGAKEAVDAWVATGSKAADALSAMVNQYKDQPDELKHINDFVNAKLDSFLEEIEESSKENDLKMQIATKANESESYDEEIFEGIFQGKKGMIEDVSKQITLVNAKLASLAQTPGMAADVQRLQNEVTQISAKMGELLGKSNKEINKEEIKKAAARLAEIPTEADKVAEKMLKQDATNKEASSILVQALALAQEAKNKEVSYLQKKEQALQKEKDSKVTVKISTDRIDYDPDNTKVVNPEVKKFQELVVNKFGKIKQIADLPQFKMMGTDGKFGKGTRDIVVILKKGFGLSDSSKDITKELMDEIQTQVIKESKSNVLSFEGYVNLYEEFNVSAAVDTAKTLPSYTPTAKPAAKAASSAGSTSKSAALYKEGSKGVEVAAIQNALKGNVGAESKSQTFGPLTKKAVMEFQKDNGLKETGEITIEDLKKLADPKRVGGNFGGSWTQSMISKLAGIETKAAAPAAKAEEKSTNTQIQTIANEIIDATNGAGTDPEKVLTAIKKIKGKSDLNILNGILKRSLAMKTIDVPGEGEKQVYAYTLAELGIKERPEKGHDSVQVIINDEMGDDNTGTVQDITDYLKSKGINASYQKDSSGEFKEDTFKIA